MKISIYGMVLAVASSVGLASCCDDFSNPPIPEPEGHIGSGAWDDPMCVWQVQQGAVNYELGKAWVRGVVVGYVNSNVSTVLNEKSATFLAGSDETAELGSNILLAADSTVRDWTKCIPVQLSIGQAREMLDLTKHPDIIGQTVCVLGTTGQKYFSANGVRDVEFCAKGEFGTEPSESMAPHPTGAFFETFDRVSSRGELEEKGWCNVVTEGNLWGWNPTKAGGEGYMAVDAFRGYSNGGPYEFWWITPAVEVDRLGEKCVSFETSAAYSAKDTSLECYILRGEDWDGALLQGEKADSVLKSRILTKAQCALAKAPESGYSAWTPSGDINLSAYAGKIVRVAWKYRAERGGVFNSTTYCLDNVNFGNLPKPEVIDWTQGRELVTMIDGASPTTDWRFENVLLDGINHVWSWVTGQGSSNYLKASAFAAGNAHASKSYAISPVVSLGGFGKAGVEFSHAAKFQTTIKELARLCVREAGTQEWIEYEVPVWPTAGSWTFVSSEMIDISAFAGKDVELALKYASTAKGADTWEITNLKVWVIE